MSVTLTRNRHPTTAVRPFWGIVPTSQGTIRKVWWLTRIWAPIGMGVLPTNAEESAVATAHVLEKKVLTSPEDPGVSAAHMLIIWKCI